MMSERTIEQALAHAKVLCGIRGTDNEAEEDLVTLAEEVLRLSGDDKELARDIEVARLEFEVCEAAIARRETEQRLFPRGAPESGDSVLNQQFVAEQKAVDALIEVRKRVEKEVLNSGNKEKARIT